MTSAVPRRPQRRLVHVLFVDLVGFTSLAEDLDAEDVALLQDHYFSRVDAAVRAAGGQVEKYIGDAVLATFGLPVLRDGDAERAVRAGLAIPASLAGVESDLGLVPGTLQARVGIHTGEVVVSWGAEGAWRLSGDVVNTAARLQAMADPGTVVVGPDTALAVGSVFAVEQLGEVTLKGKTERVPAWRVRGAPAAPRPDRPLPLLGRDADLATLLAAHRDARAAELVVVLAPPGLGRTRLAAEFAVRARATGAAVWSATVRPEDGGYALVADLLRQALAGPGGPDPVGQGPGQGPGPDRAAVVARLARHGLTGARAERSAQHVSALLAGEALDAAPEELWTSWTAVLDAQDGPTPVWIVDDAHLAGPDLLAFLAHAHDAPHRPARLLVVTARPGTQRRPWHAERPPQVLALDPLADDDVARLVESAVGPGVLPADVVDGVVRAAGGTPLYVAELLRAWEQSGVLTSGSDGGGDGGSAPAVPAIPSTIRAIYLGQLDELPDRSREVLGTGSVAGTTLPAPALPELGVPEPDPALRDLTASGLLSGPHPDPVDPRSYTYRHVLLRDAAYTTLPRSQRAALHLRFARWLADRADGTGGRGGRGGHGGLGGLVAERIGTHLATAWQEAPALGGPVEGVERDELARRAAARLTEAAEERIAVEPRRAAELFLRARDLGGPAPSEERAHRQLRAAEALRRAGELVEAMEAFAAVADAAAPGTHRPRAAAAIGFEDALFDSRLPREEHGPRALALLADALALTPPTEAATRARLTAALARARGYGGDLAAGEAVARDAVALARGAGDPGALAYALLALRPVLSAPDRLTERLAVDEELLAAARAAGDPERTFEALRLRLVDLLEHGDTDASEAARAEAEELAATLGRPVHLWYPSMWRAMAALHHGELEEAAEAVDEFGREGERWHYRDTDQVHATQLLLLHTELGTPELTLPVLRRVLPRAGPRFGVTVAVALARTGELDEARRELDLLSPDRFAVIPDDGARASLYAHAAETADVVGDAAAGAVLHELLAPWDGHAIVIGSGAACLGAADHWRGYAARAAGDLDAAVVHFRDGAAMNTATGSSRLAARSRAELARTQALREGAGPGSVPAGGERVATGIDERTT